MTDGGVGDDDGLLWDGVGGRGIGGHGVTPYKALTKKLISVYHKNRYQIFLTPSMAPVAVSFVVMD